jgi:hypothetical protein
VDRRSCNVGGVGGERSEGFRIRSMGSSNRGLRTGISSLSSSASESSELSATETSCGMPILSRFPSRDKFEDRLGRVSCAASAEDLRIRASGI